MWQWKSTSQEGLYLWRQKKPGKHVVTEKFVLTSYEATLQKKRPKQYKLQRAILQTKVAGNDSNMMAVAYKPT